jgi:hypothetical protein
MSKNIIRLRLSVQEATVIANLRDRIIPLLVNKEHVECPLCEKLCKVYPRKLNKEMARFIIRIVRRYEQGNDWVHVREVINTNTFASSNGTMLTHWGMLIHKAKDPNNTRDRTSGLWKPTQKAVDFVYERIQVPAHIRLYHDTVVDRSTELIGIREALGVEFNYEELMNG